MKTPPWEQTVHCTLNESLPNRSCKLFRPEEFLAFEYLDDIWFQQFDGPANKFSTILGYFSSIFPNLARPGSIVWLTGFVPSPLRTSTSPSVMMYILVKLSNAGYSPPCYDCPRPVLQKSL